MIREVAEVTAADDDIALLVIRILDVCRRHGAGSSPRTRCCSPRCAGLSIRGCDH